MPLHVCFILRYHNPGQPLVNYLLGGDNYTTPQPNCFLTHTIISTGQFYNYLKGVCEHF